MALWSHTSSRVVNAMETEIAPRNTYPLKDKVFHANIQIQSIEDASRLESGSSDSPKLIEGGSISEDVAYGERAAEMQMWWDEAIVRNMDLPDGYLKVAVLLIKWADQLDELKTRDEVGNIPDVADMHLANEHIIGFRT